MVNTKKAAEDGFEPYVKTATIMELLEEHTSQQQKGRRCGPCCLITFHATGLPIPTVYPNASRRLPGAILGHVWGCRRGHSVEAGEVPCAHSGMASPAVRSPALTCRSSSLSNLTSARFITSGVAHFAAASSVRNTAPRYHVVAQPSVLLPGKSGKGSCSLAALGLRSSAAMTCSLVMASWSCPQGQVTVP